MTLWLDAQLPPLLAGWINAQGWGFHAVAVRDVGMRDASDPVIFQVTIQRAGRPPRQSTPDRLTLRGQGIGGLS
jgi:hypothetical protein